MPELKKDHDIPSTSGKGFSKFVEDVGIRRQLSSEYQRGYREGQQNLALEIARLVEDRLSDHDDIAEMGKSVLPEE